MAASTSTATVVSSSSDRDDRRCVVELLFGRDRTRVHVERERADGRGRLDVDVVLGFHHRRLRCNRGRRERRRDRRRCGGEVGFGEGRRRELAVPGDRRQRRAAAPVRRAVQAFEHPAVDREIPRADSRLFAEDAGPAAAHVLAACRAPMGTGVLENPDADWTAERLHDACSPLIPEVAGLALPSPEVARS